MGQNCHVHAPVVVHIVMIDVAVGLAAANYLPVRVMAHSCFHQIFHHETTTLVVRGVSGVVVAAQNEHYQLAQMMCGYYYIENACSADKLTPAPKLAHEIICHLHQKKVSYYQLIAHPHLPGCLPCPIFLLLVVVLFSCLSPKMYGWLKIRK